MDSLEYNARYNALLERFHIAYRLSCYRTARARLHDIADLTHAYTCTVKTDELYKSLLRKYDSSEKISNIR